MRAQIRLGRIFGIEIGLHYSWLIIALLIATSLAGYFGQMHPGWSSLVIWGMAIMTAILFFVAIIVHELSHAMVARARGLPVRSITLFALGGVAQIGKEPGDARTEFWMAIVGPITSAAIGLLCIIAAMLMGWNFMTEPDAPLMSMLVWLGYINVGLAVFNMIPGFPMDGGRVLRAIIWWRTGDGFRATRLAAAAGQFIAYGFIVLGILRFFGGAGIGGLWTAFIGWFLLSASQASSMQAEVTETLRGKNVSDLMTRDCPLVEGNTNLQTFVDDYLLRTGRRCFLIAEKGDVNGLMTLNEVKAVPQQRWPFTLLYDVMVPLARLHTVSPDTPASEALEILGRENIHQLPVVSNGKLEGMISRDQIMTYLMTRAELKLSR